jgi:hypothetical protein
MRCRACNDELTDAEATAQDEHGFIDMCNYCLTKIREAEEEEFESDFSVGYRDKPSSFYDMDG